MSALVITINALPEPGDDRNYGDGKGTITDLEWTYGNGWLSLGSPLPGRFEVEVPIADAGAVLPVSIRAIGSDGRPGAASIPVNIAVPGDPSVFPVTINGEPVTSDGAQVVVVLTVFTP